MRLSRRLAVLQLVFAAVMWFSGIVPAAGCPGLGPVGGCFLSSGPAPTLAGEMEQADIVLRVVWKDARKGFLGTAGATVFEITRIVKAPEGLLRVGDKVKLSEFHAGTKGDNFQLTGTSAETIDWGTPREVTDTAWQYIDNLPSRSLSAEQRLSYFLKHLEHENELIAGDAFNEFENASYEEFLQVRESLPLEKLRQWIADPEISPVRLRLYGLMLGLSGHGDDAVALLAIINKPTHKFRQELDGIMSGYLLLSGSDGLKILEISKLANEDAPFSETYSAMQALRFMWSYEPDRIPKARLRQSMRILLDRPELADLAIGDLTRWEDWEVTDRLLEIYDDEAYDLPIVKRSIIRYLLACQKSAEEVSGEPPSYAVKATAALERVQKEDPKLYGQAIRFLRFE